MGAKKRAPSRRVGSKRSRSAKPDGTAQKDVHNVSKSEQLNPNYLQLQQGFELVGEIPVGVKRVQAVFTDEPRLDDDGQLVIDVGLIEKLAAVGMSQKEIANVVGVSDRTIRRRIVDNEMVREHVEIGLSKAVATVGLQLMRAIINGNVQAMIWWEQTRSMRRAGQDHHFSGDELVTQEQRDAAFKAMLSAKEGDRDDATRAVDAFLSKGA